MTQAGWNDVPHLDETTKRELLDATPPFLRDARSKGTPSLGAGAIYPIEMSEIEVRPFAIPRHWKKAYALDVGWNRTACLWGAQDPSDSTIYLYAEHYRGQAEPVIHAAAIKARGEWIRGCIDPASRGRQQGDGSQLLAAYQGQGLKLVPAINGVETGLYTCWEKLSIGRIKAFSTLQNFKAEYGLYRRDEHGKIVKKFDHLMDCFHGDTTVWTDAGPRRIADMVGTTGVVRTTGGDLAPYHSCQVYGRGRRTVELTFSDGSTVVCTPDHLFMSRGEWVQAIDLPGRECDTAVSQSTQRSACVSPSSRAPSRSTEASATTGAGTTSNATEGVCTSRSGRLRAAARPQTATMSTIGTGTGRIISLATFSSRLLRRTYRTIKKATLDLSLRRLSLRRQRGMEATKGVRGICSTTPQSLASFTAALSLPVSTVPSLSRVSTTGITVFAPTTARQRPGGRQVSMTSGASAPTAALASPSTGTPESLPAAGLAPLRCLSVQEAGNADVYCLTVPSTSAFAVGSSGVIAHNCMRYLLATWDQVASLQAPDGARSAFSAISDSTAGY